MSRQATESRESHCTHTHAHTQTHTQAQSHTPPHTVISKSRVPATHNTFSVPLYHSLSPSPSPSISLFLSPSPSLFLPLLLYFAFSLSLSFSLTPSPSFSLPLSSQMLYNHIISDIKRMNSKRKNNKVNTVSPELLLFSSSIQGKSPNHYIVYNNMLHTIHFMQVWTA